MKKNPTPKQRIQRKLRKHHKTMGAVLTSICNVFKVELSSDYYYNMTGVTGLEADSDYVEYN